MRVFREKLVASNSAISMISKVLREIERLEICFIRGISRTNRSLLQAKCYILWSCRSKKIVLTTTHLNKPWQVYFYALKDTRQVTSVDA